MVNRCFLFGLILFLSNVLQVKATDNSYLKLLDISKETHLDTVSKILLGEGFDVAHDNPRFFNISFEKDNVTIDVEYTPTSKHVYSYIIIADTINKADLLDGPRQVFEILISKYGTPDYAGEPHETRVKYGVNEYDLDNIISKESQLLDTLSLRHFVKGVFHPEKFEYVWKNKTFTIFYRCITVTRVVNSHYKDFFLYNITNKHTLESYYSERKEIEEHENLMDFLLKAFYVFLGCMAFVILGYFINKQRKKEQIQAELEEKERLKKQTLVHDQYKQYTNSLTNKYGNITRSIDISYYGEDNIKRYEEILVFQQPKIIIFGKNEYKFDTLLNCSIYDENPKTAPVSQVTKTNTGSMLGRAAVGALTFGVAGAIVGAVTAKKESTSSEAPDYLNSYVVKIGIKSLENPVIILKFGSDKAKAEEVYALMQAIIAMK